MNIENEIAQLKLAHAEGKVIQISSRYNDCFSDCDQGDETWTNCEPQWAENRKYRVKPWTMPEPPVGREWHRNDGWTEDMLCDGNRPLLTDEIIQEGDEGSCNSCEPIRFAVYTVSIGKTCDMGWGRTKRPLPKEPEYVPLEQSDISAAARLIWPNSKTRFSIERDDENGVTTNSEFYSYETLMEAKVKILHLRESEPQLCRKLKKD